MRQQHRLAPFFHTCILRFPISPADLNGLFRRHRQP
jgi:hypothetical protein